MLRFPETYPNLRALKINISTAEVRVFGIYLQIYCDYPTYCRKKVSRDKTN
jgi:hypothetical protein